MSRVWQAWTSDDDAWIAALRAEGLTWAEVGRRMGRTRPSVVGRADALGIRVPRPPRWTARDLDRLDVMLEQGWADELIARKLKRTVTAINLQRKRRGMASRSARLMSARRVAAMLGVGCAKRVVTWITRGYLAGKQGPMRGPHRQWQVTEEAVWAFIEAPDHWHRWDPERIPDRDLREWAIEVRAGVRFLTTGQVAWRLYVTDRAVNDWIRAGLLRAVRCGNWLVREADVEGFTPPGQRSKAGMIQRGWTAQDDEQLRAMRDGGHVWREIGLALGRSATACANRHARLMERTEAA